MADRMVVRIEGLPPWDGAYPLELRFTNRELHLVKQIANVRAGEMEEALAAGDNDLVVAWTLIAMKRAGKDVSPDVLWDAETGKIVLDTESDGVEDDAVPLTLTPSVPDDGPSGVNAASGPGLNGSSVTPDSTLSSIGSPDLVTGAI